MTSITILSVGLLMLIGLIAVAIPCANLEPNRPLFPATEVRANLTLGIIGLACAFAAGWML